jgi:RimJ/RimL family protein N-acetyltransferase
MKRDERYFFYCQDFSNLNLLSKFTLSDKYNYKLWTPKITSIVPFGLPLFPFGIWWLFHYLHVFKNREYCIFLIYEGETLIHRSCVFPGYFRFPFMLKSDLQIGDTWTHPDYRGKGMASYAIQQILLLKGKSCRKFWYITESNNYPSIRVIEKVGFKKIGEGRRKNRFGLRFIGYFEIDKDT